MAIYNKVFGQRNETADNDRGYIVQLNGTTIAISSLISKLSENMHIQKYHITINVSACYTANTYILSGSGLKKKKQVELLPDFRTRKTIIN